jgi:prophage DNA circulation protein
MAWRDNLVKASFKDVPFQADIVELSVALDIKENKKPSGLFANLLKTTPTVKNKLGKPENEAYSLKSNILIMRAYFSGEEYEANRDAFQAAVEDATAGLLILPNQLPIRALATNASFTWDNRSGGWSDVTVRFVESGLPTAAEQAKANFLFDTRAEAEAASEQLSETTSATTDEQIDTVGQPDYVAQAAEDNTDTYVDVVNESLSAGVAGVSNSFDGVKNSLAQLSATKNIVVQSGASLYSEISNIANLMRNAFSAPEAAAAALLKVFDGFEELQKVVVGTTPAKVAERINQQMYQVLVQAESISKVALLLSDLDFATVEDAATTRDNILDRIERLQEYIGDLSEGDWSEMYRDLSSIRAAVWNDISARSAALPVVDQLDIRDPMPAVVIAYQKYANADRYTEILTRNDIEQSLFTSGTIDILTA